jgi:PadR family transcriptional regulator PadR
MTKDILPELLSSWEETYKKGQLTLWIFLALKDGQKYVDEIKDFIESKSKNTINCEEQSLYRNLRKYEHIDVVTFESKKGNKGPDRKYYYFGRKEYEYLPIYDIGFRFHLSTFIAHNVISLLWFVFGFESKYENINVIYITALIWTVFLIIHFVYYLSVRKSSIKNLDKEDLFE